MPRRPRRLTIAGLMLLVALAALLVAWFLPMTERDAIRAAHRWVPRLGERPPFGETALPLAWQVRKVTRYLGNGVAPQGGYAVHMVPDGPEEKEFRATVYVDIRTRKAWSASYGPSYPSPRPESAD